MAMGLEVSEALGRFCFLNFHFNNLLCILNTFDVADTPLFIKVITSSHTLASATGGSTC